LQARRIRLVGKGEKKGTQIYPLLFMAVGEKRKKRGKRGGGLSYSLISSHVREKREHAYVEEGNRGSC